MVLGLLRVSELPLPFPSAGLGSIIWVVTLSFLFQAESRPDVFMNVVGIRVTFPYNSESVKSDVGGTSYDIN